MKRKVSWWHALLLVAVAGMALYFLFASLADTEQQDKNSSAGDVFAGTKVARIGSQILLTENGKLLNEPWHNSLWKAAFQPLEREKLIEKDLRPEVLRDLKRNADVFVQVEGIVTATEATWKTTLFLQREIYTTEGGSLLGLRRVKVAQMLDSRGKCRRAELQTALAKDIERLTDALVLHLRTPSDSSPPPMLTQYFPGSEGWNYQRELRAERAPAGASQAGSNVMGR